MKNTIIYFDGGNNYISNDPITAKQRKEITDKAKKLGHVGYLSGYKYSHYGNGYVSETVLCFFKEKPKEDEIDKRRRNGFRAAKWYHIN